MRGESFVDSLLGTLHDFQTRRVGIKKEAGGLWRTLSPFQSRLALLARRVCRLKFDARIVISNLHDDDFGDVRALQGLCRHRESNRLRTAPIRLKNNIGGCDFDEQRSGADASRAPFFASCS